VEKKRVARIKGRNVALPARCSNRLSRRNETHLGVRSAPSGFEEESSIVTFGGNDVEQGHEGPLGGGYLPLIQDGRAMVGKGYGKRKIQRSQQQVEDGKERE